MLKYAAYTIILVHVSQHCRPRSLLHFPRALSTQLGSQSEHNAKKMVTLYLSSEICSFIHFILVDILLLSYVIHFSSVLAGHINYYILAHRHKLRLIPFNVPVIGGGLVTERGLRRKILIFVRVSVVIAAAISNYGLEGRSEISFETRNARMRKPGPLLEDDGRPPLSSDLATPLIFNITQVRTNCFRLEGKKKIFGAVLDEKCYHDLTDDVFIVSSGLEPELVETTATDCEAEVDCDYFRTIFRCKSADMHCPGINRFKKRCPNEGPKAEPVRKELCEGVVYAENGDNVWLCDQGIIRPEKTGVKKEPCLPFQVERASVGKWLEYYPSLTKNRETALFAAAYGSPDEREVEVPTDEQIAVTIVNLFWFLPIAWILCTVVAISIWKGVHKFHKTPKVAHDEKELARLLDREIDGRMGNLESGREGLVRIRDKMHDSLEDGIPVTIVIDL